MPLISNSFALKAISDFYHFEVLYDVPVLSLGHRNIDEAESTPCSHTHATNGHCIMIKAVSAEQL